MRRLERATVCNETARRSIRPHVDLLAVLEAIQMG